MTNVRMQQKRHEKLSLTAGAAPYRNDRMIQQKMHNKLQ